MLIRFSVQNYRSFESEVVFSMIPGRMKKHSHHLLRDNNKSGIDVLKTALLYGANASGKSNLIKSLEFMRALVIERLSPNQPIPIQQFSLGHKKKKQPSRFEIEFKIANQAYAYGFTVDASQIHEEWLYLMNASSEKSLFERKTDEMGKAIVNFPNPQLLATNDEAFRQFIAKSTRNNQLYLSISVEQNLEEFESIYTWFAHALSIVFPESEPKGAKLFVEDETDYVKALSQFLQAMNTGISKVITKKIDINSATLPAELRTQLVHSNLYMDISRKTRSFTISGTGGGKYFLYYSNETNALELFSLQTVHETKDGREITFDFFEESDGTKRIIDLFPILYSSENQVFVIDEIERSLHPNLVRRFLELFLNSPSKGQLIVSTHESTLLDLDLLRRDEIWFLEKSPQNESVLYSLEEFAPRADLDIRRGYLNGRFGAIPILGSSLSFQEEKEETAIAS